MISFPNTNLYLIFIIIFPWKKFAKLLTAPFFDFFELQNVILNYYYNTARSIKSAIMSKLILSKHKLIITTLIGVTIGISCGLSLKHYSGRTWSQRDIMYIKFPGEIFLRMVNCLILPLITSSIASATCNLTRLGKFFKIIKVLLNKIIYVFPFIKKKIK